MALTYTFVYNGYTYGANLRLIHDSPMWKAPTADTPGVDFTFTERGRLESRRLEIEGLLSAADPESLRTAKDAFKAAHGSFTPAAFTLWTDRYCWGLLDGPLQDVLDNHRWWQWEAALFCGDGFLYSTTESSQALTVGAPTTVTAGGSAYATPYIEFTLSAAPSGGQVTITNATTSEQFICHSTLTGLHTLYCGPNCTNDYAVNFARKDRLWHATEGQATRYMDGVNPRLKVGANSITIAATGGATVSSATVKWRNRYF